MGRCAHCGGNTYRDDERDSKGRLVSDQIVYVCLQCGRVQPGALAVLERVREGRTR